MKEERGEEGRDDEFGTCLAGIRGSDRTNVEAEDGKESRVSAREVRAAAHKMDAKRSETIVHGTWTGHATHHVPYCSI